MGDGQAPRAQFAVIGVKGQQAAEYDVGFNNKAGAGYHLIRSLEVNNFRCYKAVKLDGVRRFNIITGANGSGKTALLEALFVAGGNSAEIYLRTNAWRGRDELPIPSPSDLSGLFEDFFHQFDCTNGIHIRFIDSLSGEREMRVVAAPAEVVSLPFDAKESEAVVSRDLRFTWKTPKGESESTVEVTSEGIRLTRSQDVYPMVFLNPVTQYSPKENAKRYSVLSEKNEEPAILAAVQHLFPEVRSLGVLSSGGLPAVWAQVRGIQRKLPVGLLSAGVNKFLAILLAIGTVPMGAVLIDEIENGMYHKVFPEMWSGITAFAREKHTQIFATTHSNEFLEAIAPIVATNDSDYSLIHTVKFNGESELQSFSGKKFAAAIESGFEVR